MPCHAMLCYAMLCYAAGAPGAPLGGMRPVPGVSFVLRPTDGGEGGGGGGGLVSGELCLRGVGACGPCPKAPPLCCHQQQQPQQHQYRHRRCALRPCRHRCACSSRPSTCAELRSSSVLLRPSVFMICYAMLFVRRVGACTTGYLACDGPAPPVPEPAEHGEWRTGDVFEEVEGCARAQNLY